MLGSCSPGRTATFYTWCIFSYNVSELDSRSYFNLQSSSYCNLQGLLRFGKYIMQQVEFGAAQNHLSIKGACETNCWRNDQRTVFVKVMFGQNSLIHIKSLFSFWLDGDIVYVWCYDKCNVTIYHQRVCIAVQNGSYVQNYERDYGPNTY